MGEKKRRQANALKDRAPKQSGPATRNPDLYAAALKGALEHMRHPHPDGVAAAGKTLYHNYDVYAKHAEEQRRQATGKSPPIRACKSGCSWCCHQSVEVQASEVFTIARAIADLPASQQQDIHLKIKDTANATEDFTDERWFLDRVACPLLDQMGNCSVYEMRPFACRSFWSNDANKCQSGVESGNGIPHQIDVLRSDVRGLFEAVLCEAEHILTGRVGGYRLIAALQIALENPGAVAEWRAGNDILQPAAVKQGDEIRNELYSMAHQK